jgi:sec-independent protein translocase protein TatC
MSDDPGGEKLPEGTLISHLLELRDRLLKAVIGIGIVFLPAVIYRNRLFKLAAAPLREKLHDGSTLVATTITGSFMVPIKLAMFVSLFLAMPWVLYQIWAFVAPGLYKREKRFAVPLLLSSIALFYLGVYFAYRWIFPTAFGFLMNNGPADVRQLPEINNVVDFVIRLLLCFGFAFEIPVAVVLLTLTGLVPVEKFAGARPYVVIGIFVVAAVLTPPDPMSQILMAGPMWVLYEAGVVMARLMNRSRKEKDKAQGGASDT